MGRRGSKKEEEEGGAAALFFLFFFLYPHPPIVIPQRSKESLLAVREAHYFHPVPFEHAV
jgi:hypothetical protein